MHDMRTHREAFTGHLRRFLNRYAPEELAVGR
jgi:hypothetical protein